MFLLLCFKIIIFNCVLPLMYEGEAYISVSLLPPPFSKQSVITSAYNALFKKK